MFMISFAIVWRLCVFMKIPKNIKILNGISETMHEEIEILS